MISEVDVDLSSYVEQTASSLYQCVYVNVCTFDFVMLC